MANAYDMALRGRAVAAYEGGEGPYKEVAAVFGLDHRTLERWVARYRATGSVAPRPKGGGWRCPIDLAVLHRVVRARPDGVCTELCRAYNRRVGRTQQTNETSFRRAMHREGYVLKRNAGGQANTTGRTWTRNGGPSVKNFASRADNSDREA